MSGIEILGIVLAAFPLCISAMEHYEETKKVAGTFFRIRRVHKKDLGKVKNCQLIFRLGLKELLKPLLIDAVVDHIEYEQLFASPGGPGWAEQDVETALKKRLGDCHERYIEILQEVQETMAALCDACRVNDDQFQRHLIDKQKNSNSPKNANGQARVKLMSEANSYVCFQAKKMKYAFTPTRREELLEELESQNKTLETILSATDRVSALTQQRPRVRSSPVNAKTLKFWRHADNIYKLLRTTWNCTCRSCASLWLQQSPKKLVQMSLVLQFCHGRRAVNVQLSDTPPTLQIAAPSGTGTSMANPTRTATVSIHSQSTRTPVRSGAGTATVTVTSQSRTSVTPASSTGATSPTSPLPPSLQSHGLCHLISNITHTQQDCLGRMTEGDDEYAVYPAVETVSCAQGTSLADLLRSDSALRLTREQRVGVALTLASSHLQLHPTPWLKAYWTSDDVLFPTTSDNNVATLHGEPYVLATISPTAKQATSVEALSFSTLGIVLLELCFGTPFEDHKLWATPGYATLKAEDMIRQAVARKWLEDVMGEAGEDYAMATEWTLRQSPAVLRDEKWREEFAQNVVQPLQRCYEAFHPGKGI